MPPRTPTVLEIRHEHALIDGGLRLILGAWPEFHVLPADAPSQDLQAADVVILDHDAALRRRNPLLPAGPHSLVVATIDRDTDIRGALEGGVLGYVSAACSADEIRMAARVVAAGRRYLCGHASICVADSLTSPVLTAREAEVLALVSRGRNNKEVARLLEVSLGTVKSHMRALLTKLGARCRTEAMWIASQRGLIPMLERPVPARPSLAQSHATHPDRPPSLDAPMQLLRAVAVDPRRRLSESTRLDVADASC